MPQQTQPSASNVPERWEAHVDLPRKGARRPKEKHSSTGIRLSPPRKIGSLTPGKAGIQGEANVARPLRRQTSAEEFGALRQVTNYDGEGLFQLPNLVSLICA
jgi:hypothetical protein